MSWLESIREFDRQTACDNARWGAFTLRNSCLESHSLNTLNTWMQQRRKGKTTLRNRKFLTVPQTKWVNQHKPNAICACGCGKNVFDQDHVEQVTIHRWMRTKIPKYIHEHAPWYNGIPKKENFITEGRIVYCSICNKQLGYKRKDRPQKMCKSCAKTHYKPDVNQFTYCIDCGVKVGYKSASRPAKRCWNCYITNRRNNGK